MKIRDKLLAATALTILALPTPSNAQSRGAVSVIQFLAWNPGFSRPAPQQAFSPDGVCSFWFANLVQPGMVLASYPNYPITSSLRPGIVFGFESFAGTMKFILQLNSQDGQSSDTFKSLTNMPLNSVAPHNIAFAFNTQDRTAWLRLDGMVATWDTNRTTHLGPAYNLPVQNSAWSLGGIEDQITGLPTLMVTTDLGEGPICHFETGDKLMTSTPGGTASAFAQFNGATTVPVEQGTLCDAVFGPNSPPLLCFRGEITAYLNNLGEPFTVLHGLISNAPASDPFDLIP